MKPRLLEFCEIKERLVGSNRILLATDFDGTLCPIAESPWTVAISHETASTLCRLVGSHRTTVAIITGRAAADILRRVPSGVAVAGNHGLEIVGRGCYFRHADAVRKRPRLATACEVLRDAVHRWPNAFIEDKGLSATLHYRMVDSRCHDALLDAAGRSLAAFERDLMVSTANQAVEIRPWVPWNKGTALDYIRGHLGPFDLTICLGDDLQDELMFRTNIGQLNVRVGFAGKTAAEYYLPDTSAVAHLLGYLVETRTRTSYSVDRAGWNHLSPGPGFPR